MIAENILCRVVSNTFPVTILEVIIDYAKKILHLILLISIWLLLRRDKDCKRLLKDIN